jgi:hypothetical protein
LDGAHPLTVTSILALLRKAVRVGVDPTVSTVRFGSTDETELMKEFFTLPRPPEADRPYYAPWARSSSSTPDWQTKKYPGGGLQRQRDHLRNQGQVFTKRRGPEGDEWGLTARAGKELVERQNPPVRIVDLALWLGRDVDVDGIDASVTAGTATDLDRLLAWFTHEFQPNRGDLIGTIYDDTVPAEYRAAPFSPEPLEAGTYEQLGSLPPVRMIDGSLAELVQALEARIVGWGFVLPPGLVRRALTAWMRGDIVVLVGQPGTGKSLFASLLGRAMEAELDLDPPLVVPIRADFDEAEFIGYERLDGTPEHRDFTKTVLLDEEPLEARVVILEEFNLASIETYLSSVLVATQDPSRIVRLPAGDVAHLPIDTFIIATCNSYRDEPETRTRVSSPTKRRSTIITMPNILGDKFDEDPDNAVLGLVERIISTERSRVKERTAASLAARFDSVRLANLDTITGLGDLSAEVRDALHEVAHSILDTPTGRAWFTMGLLRDIVLNLAHAPRIADDELAALGQSVSDKLIHQVRGRSEDVEDFRAACQHLPNAEEIARLLDRMMDGPADELMPLL